MIPVFVRQFNHRGSKNLSRIRESIVNMIFPRRCPVCDEPVKPVHALVCRDCEDVLAIPEGDRCMCCGKPLTEKESDREFCGDCSVKEHLFDRGYSLFAYKNAAKSVYRFKYRGGVSMPIFMRTVLCVCMREAETAWLCVRGEA